MATVMDEVKVSNVSGVTFDNPYPDEECKSITDFEYLSDLVLLRAREGGHFREGKREPDYIVAEDYSVRFTVNGSKKMQITVPKGLFTDLVSVPAPLRGIVGRVGPHLEAGIVHDFLYVAWQDVPGRSANKNDKKFADKLMLEAMKVAKVNVIKRYIVYSMVTLFGFIPYKKEKPLPRYHQFN